MNTVALLLKWDRFLAPNMLPSLYFISLALVAVSALASIRLFFGFVETGQITFLMQLVLFSALILVHILAFGMVRVAFEMFNVVFRIHDSISLLKKKYV